MEDFTYNTLTLIAPQDTDADTAVVLTANVQDKTDNSVTNSTVVNPTLVVDAILDDSIDVSATVVNDTEEVNAQTISLGLDVPLTHSQVQEPVDRILTAAKAAP